MGQTESQPAGLSASVAATGVALHVLRVAERSPAAEAGIDPFFDFICGVNGHQIGDDIDSLTQVLEQREGSTVILQVWSTKRRELRDVDVIPSRHWSSGGSAASGQVEGQPSLLGLSLRVCHPQAALEQVWHVLEILEGSPAQSAGLVPFGDWIVGYAGGVLRGEGDFYDVVEAHVDRPLRLFVYNADYDVTREAILIPNRSWGGEGLLGCGVGYGLLHRIPRPQDRVLEDGTGWDEEVEEERPVEIEVPIQGRVVRTHSGSGGGGGHQPSLLLEDEYAASGGFEVSSGVSVVPLDQEEEGGFETFVPADYRGGEEGIRIMGGRPFVSTPYEPSRGVFEGDNGFNLRGGGGTGAFDGETPFRRKGGRGRDED